MMRTMKSRSVKAVVITAAVLVILGGVLAALLLTKPKPKPASGDPNSDVSKSSSAFITDKSADKVLSITVENSEGTYTFTRQKRTINTENESGEPIKYDEFFWTSEELKGVPQSDSSVRNFLADIASLPEQRSVEDNAEDLYKYGLENPAASAVLRFDDGTTAEMRFGIRNPADDSGVYFTLNGSRDVKLVNYYAISEVFSDIRQFARLSVTDSTAPPETLTITRPELDAPLELKMTAASGEDSTDAFRFTSPIAAELDAKKGRELFYGACGLTMDACEFLEQTDENMERCGLTEPRAVVAFSFGGTEYELLIGNEIRRTLTSDDESRLAAETITGYYAVMKGVPGIYSLARENAPWVSATVGSLISQKPLSPYIFSVSSVEVTLADGSYTFKNENEQFTYNGSLLPYENFRELFNTLTGELDGEAFAGEISREPIAEVTFNYKTDEYGTDSDTLSFYELDERRCAVVLNGTPLFAVTKVFTERVAEQVAALTGEADPNRQNL